MDSSLWLATGDLNFLQLGLLGWSSHGFQNLLLKADLLGEFGQSFLCLFSLLLGCNGNVLLHFEAICEHLLFVFGSRKLGGNVAQGLFLLCVIEILDLFNVGQGSLATVFQCCWIAWVPLVSVDKLLQGIVVAGTIICLTIIRSLLSEVLDCWISLDTILFTQWLAFISCAVHIGNKSFAISLVEHATKAVPVWFQLLAVASPWCKEFHEGDIPPALEDFLLEGFSGERQGVTICTCKCEKKHQ